LPEQALYLTWRPVRFEDVVGQDHIVRTLRHAIASDRLRHAYLFSGPRGTGKTTTARLLAKAVNCTTADPMARPCNACEHCVAINENRFLDLIEIDAASHTGVDDVRDLRDRIAFSPSHGRYKVYIIDEVHRFSGNAFDALLKTLEEPPEHAMFILATTEIDRVPATIMSRCLPFEFRRVSVREVADRLQLIVESGGLQVDRQVLEMVARQGTGSVRDSISLLDQIVADPDERITMEMVQHILGTTRWLEVRGLVEALLDEDRASALRAINHALDSGSDPRHLAQQIVDHLRAILIAQTAGFDLLDVSEDDQQLMHQQAQRCTRAWLTRAIRAFNSASRDMVGGWHPQLPLELAVIESLEEEAVPVPFMPAVSVAAPQATSAASSDDIANALPGYEPRGEPPVVQLEAVLQNWVAAQRLIRKHAQEGAEPVRMLPALMDEARPVWVDGNQIVIAAETPFVLGKFRSPRRISWLQRALQRVLNEESLTVVFVLAEQFQRPGLVTSEQRPGDPLLDSMVEMGGVIQSGDRNPDAPDDEAPGLGAH
jgi:DNA polymerase III subunit gamma/tau